MKLSGKALYCAIVIATCSSVGSVLAAQGSSSTIMCRSGTLTTVARTDDTFIYNVDHRGTIVSEDGAKTFDNFTHHCSGTVAMVNGKASGGGFCRYVDPATGDLVFASWSPGDKAGTGTYKYIGGTGKWKGISGSGDYQLVAKTLPISEGTYQNCVRCKDTFTLP